MSNHLAIATVTETLRQLLNDAVKGVDVAAEAKAARPVASTGGAASGLPTVGVNIFLYQLTPNAAGRNLDLPQRNGSGDLVRRPRVALDLHYLLSFYGPDAELVTHRLLGRVVQTLHAQPVLTRPQIRSVVTSSSFLTKSNLADEVELVKFSPLALSLEELSKLWSVFFQTTYALSLAYQGTVVLIEGDESPRQPLPVRERTVQAIPFQRPNIEGVTPQIVEAGGTLVLRGASFAADHVRVAFGSASATPTVLADDRIEVKLPAGLAPGIQTVQVVHLLKFGAEFRRVFESNVAAFVLAPAFNLSVPPPAEPAFGTVTRGQPLTLPLKPPVKREQEVRLLLGSRTLLLPPRAPDAPATASDVSFTIPADFPTGEYFVRVGVEGAQSVPFGDSTTGFTGPKIKIVAGAKSLRCSVGALGAALATVAGAATITDENAAPMPGVTVAARWTFPDGATLDDVQKTGASGIAQFTIGRDLAGTYTLAVSEVTLAGFAFDQLGSGPLAQSLAVP